MKKIIFILIGVASYTLSFAQFNQGNFLLGGSTRFSTSFETNKSKNGGTTTTNYKTTSFSLQPQAGYFVIDNLAAGLGIDLSSTSQKADGSSDKFVNSQFTFAPFVRYYLFDKFYGQGSVTFGSAKYKQTIGGTTTETKYSVGGWSLLGGYAFFLNDAVSLEPQVGYASSSRKAKNSNGKNIDAGLFIGVGLYAYISK